MTQEPGAPPVPDASWRPAPGTPHGDLSAQQDSAAGGKQRRRVRLPDGQLGQASVILRGRGSEVRAHLRYASDGKMKELPLGRFSAPTRAENLRAAWDRAHQRGLTIGDVVDG